MPEEKIHELIDGFLSERDIKKSSIATYKRVINLYFRFIKAKNQDYRKINAVIEFKNSLLINHCPKTVNLYLSVVKVFYKWFAGSGLGTNAAIGVKLSKIPHVYRKMPLNTEQVIKLLKSPDLNTPIGLRDYLLMSLLVKTGLRRIEINRLDIGDIDYQYSVPILRIQRKGRDSKDSVKVISNELRDELRSLVATREGVNDSSPLFVTISKNCKTQRLSVTRISEIVKGHLNRIGLTGKFYSVHSLRHTAAVSLLEQGYDLQYVQIFMGHASPGTTMLYTKLINDRLGYDQKGINSLDNLFKISMNP